MQVIKIFDIDNTSVLSDKEIKELVNKIDIAKYINSKELLELAKSFKKDNRKNINAIGDKIIKQIENLKKEISRVRGMYDFDKSFGDYNFVAGVDEVGRGPLAGPIVACSVILDKNTIDDDLILGLNDSKKLSEKKREELAEIIKDKAIAYQIAKVSNEEIDQKGISFANNKIFLDSLYGLKVEPDLVLSDGYLVKGVKYPNQAVIKGDTKSAAIAAASIVAKVYRDSLMKEYAKKYPYYDFENNAGYGTAKHIEGLKENGACKIHRQSFISKIMNEE